MKKYYEDYQGGLDETELVPGIIAGGIASDVGDMSSDPALGATKTTVAARAIAARDQLDKKTEQFGRIETNVYMALKKAYNEPGSLIDKKDIMTLTKSLFDISEEQVSALFKHSDEHDLVSARGIIRPSFTNLSPDALKESAYAEKIRVYQAHIDREREKEARH